MFRSRLFGARLFAARLFNGDDAVTPPAADAAPANPMIVHVGFMMMR